MHRNIVSGTQEIKKLLYFCAENKSWFIFLRQKSRFFSEQMGQECFQLFVDIIMKTYALRLHSHQDLKKELIYFTKKKNIQSGFILTCVGSLKRAILRMADESIKSFEEQFEIVSLVGTLSPENVHLHISLSNKNGGTIGGHLKDGCSIHTTAKIVIGDLDDLKFLREFDEQTGFKELVMRKIDRKPLTLVSG